MYLQGNLQNVFDALYHLGVIDPVLEMDWSDALEKMNRDWDQFSSVVSIANQYQDKPEVLMFELKKFQPDVLGYLAMEVAKEFADFHSRDELQ